MKRIAFAFTIVLGLAACGDNKATLETTINSALENQMTVSEVNMTADASGNYSGYAKGKTKDGLAATRNCVATRSESDFNWSCVPGIDEDTLRSVENTIKAGLAEKGEVTEVHLKKGADEDHMVGGVSLTVDDQAVTATCTAERDPLKTGTSFKWSCQ
ncbi:MAG: hypothetical protein V4459_14075 [Pseudomonadota bacterium]